jgi:hypothetical protein
MDAQTAIKAVCALTTPWGPSPCSPARLLLAANPVCPGNEKFRIREQILAGERLGWQNMISTKQNFQLEITA